MLDIENRIRLASGRNSRGSTEYEQVRSRVTRSRATRSGHSAPHQVDTWGRSVVEQIRQWQQALQAEQIMDAEPKRVSSRSAFQITETKEGGTMIITTTRVTQMRDIVKTSQDGTQSAKEILWWLSIQQHKVHRRYFNLC